MTIETLISTMNLDNHNKFIEKMNVKKSLTINQTNQKKLDDIIDSQHTLYSYNEKGLSKSRNRAIEKSKADICILADDDLTYKDGYSKIVEDGYKKYPDADIIAFYVDNVYENYRRPKRKEGKINFLKSMRIQSVQITFKRKSIINKKIKFNEKFGTGTDLYMGEENIFLTECLKKGLKIYYIPETIAVLQDNNSTWFKGYNKQYFHVKGTVFYEMSKKLYPLLIIQFAIRKRKLYSKNISTINAIKYMLEGVKKYKEEN